MKNKNIGTDFDDFLMDENDTSLTLTTLAGAAAALGRRIKLELTPV